ncbi:RING finger protein 25, variant 5 [Schistosoma haematobium]|uniref:RING finger protein 25, variant 5 n=1 Tax=Schistosoma haematobium TaxID=6185 RepID=A0A922INX1_SCHHA|nr:RING finger protein 25, variant 5 [Schistosoma haematobium]KAH9583739.1 RING finger protein 25, variant 5 [Schistosoma haematobium]
MWSILAVTSTSAFGASTGMLSSPTALPLLICLIAMLISSIVCGPTSIGRSVGAASMLGGFSGAGLLKSSLKCSASLFRCSSTLVITLPSLLFTGRPGLR